MNQRVAHARGFTLMEIMVALLVFAVGGAAVAALFPTAILCRERSVNDGVGTMICSNGLAILKTRAKADDLAPTGALPDSLHPIVAENDVDIVPLAQQHWGTHDDMGFAALGQRLTADGTCRLVIVAYHKRQAGQVRWRDAKVLVQGARPNEVKVLPGSPAREGMPLIWQATGAYAYIVGMKEDAGIPIAVLSRDVQVPANKTAYVLVEDKAGTLTSPAMRVLCARAELQP